MKKIASLILSLAMVLSVFAVSVNAAVPVKADNISVSVNQTYEEDVTTDDFAYTCWEARRPEKTTDGDNTVLDLTPQKHTEASIEGINDMSSLELQFDAKALYASSELRVQFKLDDCTATLRFRPGIFADAIYEKPESDFAADSNIAKEMWMASAATVDDTADLVSDEWYTFNIKADTAQIREQAYPYNAFTIQYKKSTDEAFTTLARNATEKPWEASWAVTKTNVADICTTNTCNVFISNPSDGGQQYGVWKFDAEADTVTKLAAQSHYVIDNVIFSGKGIGEAYTTEGVLFNAYCDEYTTAAPTVFTAFSQATSSLVADANGNKSVEFVQNYSGTRYGQGNEVQLTRLPENFVVTIDVYQHEDNNRSFRFEAFDENGKAVSLNLWPANISQGKWYRLKFVKNGDVNGFTLYTKDLEAGTVKKTYEGNAGAPTSRKSKFFIRTDMESGPAQATNEAKKYHWSVNNLTVSELNSASITSAVKSGNTVTAKVKFDGNVDAAVTNPCVWNSTRNVTAILALYKGDTFKVADFSTVTLKDADVNGVEATVSATSDDFDKAIVFVWNNIGVDAQPILKTIDITDIIK